MNEERAEGFWWVWAAGCEIPWVAYVSGAEASSCWVRPANMPFEIPSIFPTDDARITWVAYLGTEPLELSSGKAIEMLAE
jgi:hypothetical protein